MIQTAEKVVREHMWEAFLSNLPLAMAENFRHHRMNATASAIRQAMEGAAVQCAIATVNAGIEVGEIKRGDS